MAATLYVAIIGTALAQALWNMALTNLPAGICSMFYPLQALTAAILGIIILNESLTPRIIIGGVIITAAILAGFIPEKKSPKP